MGPEVFTWISNARLCPLNANAMMPNAFSIGKIDAVEDGDDKGWYDIEGGFVRLTDSTQVIVA